jgi:hypothetical protein
LTEVRNKRHLFFVTLYWKVGQDEESETAETENTYNTTAAKSEGKIVFRMIILKWVFYCTVHFDNIKILFTNECTLY